MRDKLRPVRLGPMSASIERRADGVMVCRNNEPLGDYPKTITDRLVHWVAKTPDAVLFAQRGSNGEWIKLTYADALKKVRSVGQALLDRGLNQNKPVAILSENDIEQAIITLACQHVGVPVTPVSPSYSLVSNDFERLKYVLDQVQPGLVYATDGSKFAKALQCVAAGIEIVVASDAPANIKATPFANLLTTTPGTQVDAAHEAIHADDVAKIMFTSGSTGTPKGVMTTHRMLCSNQQMTLQVFRFFEDEPPVLVDWLAWSHVFGGNHNFGLAVYNGGSFYIDDGKPVPNLFHKTVANLSDIATNVYFNVPRGYEELLVHLESNADFAKFFFSRVKVLFYAGAALSKPLWDRLVAISSKTCGERIMMMTDMGGTEASPMATAATHDAPRAGEVGIAAAGVEIKLVPTDGLWELRILGPNIFPGYWRQPELTAQAFDEEGYYKIGDALKFVDPDDINRGFLFGGRIGENFKLVTGTWVSVATLRTRIIEHFAPFVRDAVITGHDRDFIGALLIMNPYAVQATFANADGVSLDKTRLQLELSNRLNVMGKSAGGSSELVMRALVLETPLSLDAGEVTDKGSVNQHKVRECRAALVEALHATNPDSDVIIYESH